MTDKQEKERPKWLSELQQKSWEPEILLSGIVLYGMFQVPDLLDQFLLYFKSNIFGRVSDLDNMIAILKMGIYWLISGLVLHLISRGIWVGLVGLSYTFPGGIDADKSKFQGRFKQQLSSLTGIDKSIVQLEKISSSLFSVSFMLFMSLLGGYLYMFVLLILPFLILTGVFDYGFQSAPIAYLQYYSWPIVIVGLLAMFDFVSLGLLKRIKWLEQVYWPLHRIVSFLTLSRFYSKVYYAFVTNTNKWLFAALLILFIFTSILGATRSVVDTYGGDSFSRLSLWHSNGSEMIFPGHYADDQSVVRSRFAHIQSDIITGNSIKLFVVADINYEDSIRSYANYDSLKAALPELKDRDRDLLAIQKFYHIYLDDSLIKDTRWFYYFHSNTSQRGYVAYLDISTVSTGIHTVQVALPPDQFSESSKVVIEYYRE